MADEKKVVLFIVEGPSEETALEPLFKQLFDRKRVQFHVAHCDITKRGVKPLPLGMGI